MKDYQTETGLKSLSDFNKNAIKALRESDEEDQKELTGFLMKLYGYESVLSKEDFLLQIVKKDTNWIFQAESIRKKIKIFYPPEVHDTLIN